MIARNVHRIRKNVLMLKKTDFKILNCIMLLQRIDLRGESKIRLSDIAFWTKLNKMTVHRHLVFLEKHGFVSRKKEPYKNHEIHYWKTEELAHDLERIGEVW